MSMMAGRYGEHFFAVSEETGTFTVTPDEPAPGFTTLAFSDADSSSSMVVPSAQYELANKTYLGVSP
jgi:hypothetical protein